MTQATSVGPEILKGAPATHREAAEKVLRQKGVSVVRNRKVEPLKLDCPDPMLAYWCGSGCARACRASVWQTAHGRARDDLLG